MKLILASKSPRRSELLKKINVNFKVVDSEVDETTLSEKIPERYCQKLASLKAKSVLKKFPEYTIIGADTIVEIEKEILEKPSSFSDAYSMLEKLSGKKIVVDEGVISSYNGKNYLSIQTSEGGGTQGHATIWRTNNASARIAYGAEL